MNKLKHVGPFLNTVFVSAPECRDTVPTSYGRRHTFRDYIIALHHSITSSCSIVPRLPSKPRGWSLTDRLVREKATPETRERKQRLHTSLGEPERFECEPGSTGKTRRVQTKTPMHARRDRYYMSVRPRKSTNKAVTPY